MTDASQSPNTPTNHSPQWHKYMVPLLRALSDGAPVEKRVAEQRTIEIAGVTAEQQAELLPSGDSRVLNRIGWATSHLFQAQAIFRPARAVLQITDAGRQLLAQHPEGITNAMLEKIPAFQQYVPIKGKFAAGPNAATPLSPDEVDPLEQIESGIAQFDAEVASGLIRRLQEQHPDFFEQAVVDLLIAMGYGGAEQRVKRLGRTGDGGVDGVIDQDALGLNRIYMQAKRYAVGNTVQRPEIQGFVGALADKGATQGVFVTTSSFSSGALEYVERISSRVVLIDGARLAELMIRYRVAVQVKSTHVVVEIDEDYFD